MDRILGNQALESFIRNDFSNLSFFNVSRTQSKKEKAPVTNSFETSRLSLSLSLSSQLPHQDSKKPSLVLKMLEKKELDGPVILNVGGKKHMVLCVWILKTFNIKKQIFILGYKVTWSLIKRLPQTRLGHLNQVRTEEELFKYCDGYIPDSNEFIFHRGPR